MDILQNICTIENFTKYLYPPYLFLGAAGGLYFFFDLYSKRMRIMVRRVEEILALHDKWEGSNPSIRFEITNLGRFVTSLSPIISLRGYNLNGRKITAFFELHVIDRSLESHIPKVFCAISPKDINNYEFLWLKTYTFKLTSGEEKRIRYDNADMNVMGYWKYIYKLLLFKLLKNNKVTPKKAA